MSCPLGVTIACRDIAPATAEYWANKDVSFIPSFIGEL